MDVPPSNATQGPHSARAKLVLVHSSDDCLQMLGTEVLPHRLAQLAGIWAGPRKGRSGRRRRALVIAAVLPGEADAVPGSVLSQAMALRLLGYDVALAPVDGKLDGPGQVLAEYGITSLGRPVHRSLEEVLQRHAATLDVVLIQGAELARAYEPLVRLHGPAARVVCSLSGLQHPDLVRQARTEPRRDLVLAARALQRQEMLAAYACDAVVLPSEEDAAVLRDALPGIDAHAATAGEAGGEAGDPAFRRAIEGQQRLRLAVP